MAVCDLVVVGSYPPVPGPATAATLGAVRRGWDAGSSVQVVSYRSGAAPISVPVTGPLAGWRLEHVRRHFEARPARARCAARGALHRLPPAPTDGHGPWAFDGHPAVLAATLIVAEDPEVLPACLRSWPARRVGGRAHARPGRRLADRYGLQPAAVTVERLTRTPILPTVSTPAQREFTGPGRPRTYRRPAAHHDRGGQGPAPGSGPSSR